MSTGFIANDIETLRAQEESARKQYERTTIIDGGFSIAELRAAFEAVQDMTNWKNPIDAWIHPTLFDVTRRAIIFFAGCELTGGTVKDGRINIKAVGYYAAIGA